MQPSSSSPQSPQSSHSDNLPIDLIIKHEETMKKCAVCSRPAFCFNYGVFTCNACKMFFRRVEVDKISYICKYWNNCYEVKPNGNPHNLQKCRACRFRRCLDVGMKYIPPGKPSLAVDIKMSNDECNFLLIKNLLCLEKRKTSRLVDFYNDENPTLEDVVNQVESSKLLPKTPQTQISIHEWSVIAVHTSCELFLSLSFMDDLNSIDKMTLLKHYALRSVLLGSALRAYHKKRDRVTTPDDNDVYPDSLYKLSKFSHEFLHRIRSRLVSKLIDLKITDEEHALTNVILFCNPAVSPLTDNGRLVIANQQKIFNAALLQYCLFKYQKHGPSRFTDLLSLCHVINKNFEDVHYLTTLFQFYIPSIKLKRLFLDVFHNIP